MIATFEDFRLPNGNPASRLTVDGRTFTVPFGNVGRANSILKQYGYKAMWKEWKLEGRCGHPYYRPYLRRRVIHEG